MIHLNLRLMEEMEAEQKREDIMSTFFSFHNNHLFGDPFPITESDMHIFKKRQIVGEDDDEEFHSTVWQD